MTNQRQPQAHKTAPQIYNALFGGTSPTDHVEARRIVTLAGLRTVDVTGQIFVHVSTLLEIFTPDELKTAGMGDEMVQAFVRKNDSLNRSTETTVPKQGGEVVVSPWAKLLFGAKPTHFTVGVVESGGALYERPLGYTVRLALGDTKSENDAFLEAVKTAGGVLEVLMALPPEGFRGVVTAVPSNNVLNVRNGQCYFWGTEYRYPKSCFFWPARVQRDGKDVIVPIGFDLDTGLLVHWDETVAATKGPRELYGVQNGRERERLMPDGTAYLEFEPEFKTPQKALSAPVAPAPSASSPTDLNPASPQEVPPVNEE